MDVKVYETTEDEENYTVTFGEPVEVAKSEDTDADIREATAKQARLHEEAIREAPKFWFWCHRRWKTDYPEVYHSS